MWCPNCKSEYRDGFTVCTECGAKLVEKLPTQPAFDPVFLEKTEGDSAWELPELLRRAGIACYLYSGNGTFIRLLPEQEVPGELYVDRKDLQTAQRCRNMLTAPPQPVQEDELMEAYEEYMDDAEPEPDEETESGSVAWKLFVVLGILAVGCVLFAIFSH